MLSNSLTEILEDKSSLANVGITFIEASDGEVFLSYKELYALAGKGLSYLQQAGMRPGDELVFQLTDNRSLVITFWACLLGGIIPVPLTTGNNDDHRQKIFGVWPVLNNPYLIVSDEGTGKLLAASGHSRLEDALPGITGKIVYENALLAATAPGTKYPVRGSDIAFIQFSSGSTGNPKGVVLTHHNLLTNMRAIARAGAYSPDDSMLSWMPLTHDMGMIGFHLNPLIIGMNQFLMNASLFVRRPDLWLAEASRHRISILSSPNFGYEYVLKHCDLDAGERLELSSQHRLDLSSVRILYNGAEPVSEKLCRRFLQALAGYGLKSSCMCPVYGLAEASLAVSIPDITGEIISCRVDRNALKIGDRIRPVEEDENAVSFVNVGSPVDACLLRIAGEDDQPLPEESIGHIHIRGENVTAGYYNNAPATKDAQTADGWLKTGDLGFIRQGFLYITGRFKDLIIVNGQNYYPHDIEGVAQEVDGIQLNRVAVAGFYNPAIQQEQIVAFVLHRGTPEEFAPTARRLTEVVSKRIGIRIEKVVPVKEIPRTTSGKLQRFRLLERFARGEFDNVLEDTPQPACPWPAHSLTKIWKDVLGNTPAGPESDFFLMGGNSLRAAEMEMLIWKEFQVEFPARTLYEKKTLRQIAAAIEEAREKVYTPLEKVAGNPAYPLSFAQKRIYYACREEKTTIAYNIPIAFNFNGPLQADRLEQSIRQLIGRHESLRTSFHGDDDPIYRVQEYNDFHLRVSELNPEAARDRLQDLVQPFDLARAPLFRAELFRLEVGKFILFLDFHHLIADGVSVGLFMDELMKEYAGELLPASPPQYKEFVHWETTRMTSEKYKAQREYWKDRLHGHLPSLELATDYQRPVHVNTAGAKMEFTLDRALSLGLHQLALNEGCGMHVLLLTLYTILLARYSGQDELLIGIPVAARRHPDLQLMQGMLVNNLVIRSQLPAGGSFTDLLRHEEGRLAEALDNQDLPFEEVVREAGIKREAGRHPLFDTMFIYQNMAMPVHPTPDLTLSRHFFNPRSAKFDCSMEIFEEPGNLQYYIEYTTALFREDTITAMAAHFRNLAQAVVKDPHVPLSDLSLLAEKEYDCLIRSFNATDKAYPGEKTLYPLFARQVFQTPEAVALQYGSQTISYRSLNEKATGWAAFLRSRGVTQDAPVALFLPSSPALLIGMLAVLKAGGYYLPLNTDLPEERLKWLLTDSRCRHIVTTRYFETRLPQGLAPAQQIFLIDPAGCDDSPSVLPSSALSSSAPPPEEAPSPSDLAYVLYTSGTTGTPKGVMIEHRSLVNYLNWAAEVYAGTGRADFPLFTSPSFDLTVTALFTPLVTGNKLVIYADAQSTLLIDTVIADNQSDILKLTPSHLKLLLESRWLDPATTRIRKLIVGGEKLVTSLAEQVYARFHANIEIFNEYGPTEATVGCMIHRFRPGSGLPAVPIGVPAANTRIYLLDKQLLPVPAGVQGELFIAGQGLARGYLHDDELTRQKFIPDPFVAGSRMYRTGDIGRWLPGQVLDYIGRTDHQVKINGYRIGLPEIENALQTFPGISHSLVTLKRDEKGQEKIYAYYTTGTLPEDYHQPEAYHQADAIRGHLSKRLPHYMIPSYFVRIDRIPLTNNGKVDYDRLPEPPAHPAGTTDNVPPRNDLESALLNAWQTVLGDSIRSVKDNFFESGGDSIKAFQISSRLGEQGISLAARDILTYFTIEQICLHADITALKKEYEQGILWGEKAATPIETWFLVQDLDNPHYYNQSVLLTLHRQVNRQCLQETFQRLIAHHDGLRMNFNPSGKTFFYNNAHLEQPFILEEAIIPASAHPDEELAAIGSRLKSGFDINRGLLLKAALVREEDGGESLLIVAHHLVVDGISWRILLEDLYSVYTALESSIPVRLPAKTASLIDWSKALNAYEASISGQHVPAPTSPSPSPSHTNESDGLPIDIPTNEWRAAHAGKITGRLSKDDTSILVKEAQRIYQSDMPVLLNTALALALEQCTGCNSFLTEQESHGRLLPDLDLSRTVGWFTAIYPLRLDLKGSLMGDKIKAIKEQLRTVPAQALVFGINQSATGPRVRTAGRIVGLRFNYLGQFDREWDNDLFSYDPRPTGPDTDPANRMSARIEINCMIMTGELRLEINYNKNAYTARTMEEFRNAFLDNLNLVLQHLRDERQTYFTPSDFDAALLDQEELNALFS
jgi:amino acid adenylation domain-containing protein/non-ribosomal peptide synthase protein (TIGR01720 family)